MDTYTMIPIRIPGIRSIVDYTCYSNTYVILGKINEGKKLFLENGPITCRDIMVGLFKEDYLLSYLENRGTAHMVREESGCVPIGVINTGKTAFAIFSTAMSQRKLDDGLNSLLPLLNKFEKARKWKRTKYHGFKIKGKTIATAVNGGKMITGSKCWSSNPFFLYIYLAAFKLFTYYDCEYEGKNFIEIVKTAKTLQEAFEFAEECLTRYHYQYGGASKWLKVIKDRRKIFKGFTADDLFFTEKCRKLQITTLNDIGVHFLLSCEHSVLWERSLKRIINSEGVTLLQRIGPWRKENNINGRKE